MLGTILPVTSGYYANQSYHLLKAGIPNDRKLFGLITMFPATAFPSVQSPEYNSTGLTISSGIYGSFPYLPTGFHGFHVTVGLIFLSIQYDRISNDEPASNHGSVNRVNHVGLFLGVMHRHSVDIIRIHPFVNVYVYDSLIDSFKESVHRTVDDSVTFFDALFDYDGYHIVGNSFGMSIQYQEMLHFLREHLRYGRDMVIGPDGVRTDVYR